MRLNLGSHDAGTNPLGHIWGRWRAEGWIVALLVALVGGIHGARLTALNLRGEESRRAQVAVEMIRTGDWVVPRQQGQEFLSRPPLQNWAIAAVGLLRGEVDVVAIRLPSMLAVVLTALLIYGYGRTMLGPLGSFTAAAAFATMGQVLELGNLGETEALFTLLVSGSLLLWHWGYLRRWAAVCTWTTAYLMVALGLLAKGLQAPCYFAAVVGMFLLVTRRWRDALHWGHLVGIATFLAVWAAWQAPFYLRTSWESVWEIFAGDVGMRFADTSWTTILQHLAFYPVEVFAGCLLPWSVLLVAYVNRDFRASLGAARQQVLFLTVCLAVTFPTCWLPPGARGRYFMPMYPCVALLVGLVVERTWQAGKSGSWVPLWRNYLAGMALVMWVAAVALGVLGFRGDHDASLGQDWGLTIFLMLAAGGLGALAMLARRDFSQRAMWQGVLAIATFLALGWNGPIINAKLHIADLSTPTAVAEVKRRLPPQTQLVSLGPTDHLFAYYFREPIRQVTWPKQPAEAADYEYFCYSTLFGEGPSLERLPFAFETIAVVSCECRRVEKPGRVVIVARRLPAAETIAETADKRHDPSLQR